MTCIVGMIDKENGCVWIGGDSLGSNGYTKSVQTQSKVFRNKIFDDVIIGSTSSFRHIDLLKYSSDIFDEIDKYKKTPIDHEYMVTKAIPNIHRIFKNGIYNENETDKGANFLIGVRERLFEIQHDYSVLEPALGFSAVGSGYAVAMGSMFATKESEISVESKLVIALMAAESYACGVQRPFILINTKDDSIKKFE